ncbi:uncharacterized protein LODBEIA_P53230 [Lodderomyces beijingensis]|uniref:Proline dehydrogenase n=1 Tax=Lodderomyces beijingensis TaxID=1775926 RepID=A0ABP0ZSH8_9ASCO
MSVRLLTSSAKLSRPFLVPRTAARAAALAARVTQARFHDTPHKSTIVSPSTSTPPPVGQENQVSFTQPQAGEEADQPRQVSPHAYLKSFTNMELVGFFTMGLCTLNKAVLTACIKLFPYLPLPLIKTLIYRIYCSGETPADIIKTAARLNERGIKNVMMSLTIEACEDNPNIDPDYIIDQTNLSINEALVPHMVKMIEEAGRDKINDIPPGYIALKPTGFVKNAAHVLANYNNGEEEAFAHLLSKAERACQAVYDANQKLSHQYPERIAPFVVAVVDAEKFDLQPGVYELQRQLYQKFNKLNQPVNVVGTLQMYLTDSCSLLTFEEKLAKLNNYRLGLKLVRGAYIHSEKNRSVVIHKTKEDTDNNYNAGISYCIDSILEQNSNANANESTIGHLVVASHNADSLRLASSKVYNNTTAQNKNKNNVVLGQLLGMADDVTYDLIKNHKINNVIKYVPWGPPLETKQYLLRRLEENGDAVKSGNGWPLVKATFATLMGRVFKIST